MQALGYIIYRSVFNFLKSLFTKPARLILTIFLLAMFGLVIFSTFLQEQPDSGKLWAVSFDTVFLGIVLLTLFTTIQTGLGQGQTIFSMADVNLAFVAPLKSHSILVYGLLRQMGTTLATTLFLFFQMSTLRTFFGILPNQAVWVIIAWIAMVFLGQMFAMALFIYTSKAPERRAKAKKISKAVALLLGLAACAFVYLSQDHMAALNALSNPAWLGYVPVIGWLVRLAGAGISGAYVSALFYLGLVVLSVLACGVWIWRTEPDYYEDVLAQTERKQAVLMAAKSGKVANDASTNTKAVRVKKSGIGRGMGASVLFFTQLGSQSRSGILMLDYATIISIIIVVGMKLILPAEVPVLAPAFWLMVYLQFFLGFKSGWTQELVKPFIYLIPENPFKKMLYANLLPPLKALIDAVIAFGVLFAMGGVSVIEAIGAALAYASFSLLFAAAMIAATKLLGSSHAKVLAMVVWMLMIVLLVAPAAIGYFVLLAFSVPACLALFAISVYGFGLSFLIMLLCRNQLHDMSMD